MREAIEDLPTGDPDRRVESVGFRSGGKDYFARWVASHGARELPEMPECLIGAFPDAVVTTAATVCHDPEVFDEIAREAPSLFLMRWGENFSMEPLPWPATP